MRPLPKEAITRMALAQGAKLEIDGKPVNSARHQVAVAPPEKPAYMPPSAPAAPQETMQPKPDPVLTETARAVEQMAAHQLALGESNERIMQSVRDVLQQALAQQVPPPQQRPVKWVFKIKRDAQDLMESIEATAIYR